MYVRLKPYLPITLERFSFFALLAILFLFSINGYAQSDSLRYFLNEVQLNSAVNMRERVYVHMDKEVYQPGDTMYIAAYVTERLSQKLGSQANTLWGMITEPNGDIVIKERFLMVGGKAKGQFVIPEGTENGIYQLNAFTNWQKNLSGEGVFVGRFEVRSLKTPTVRWGIEELHKAYAPGDTVDIKVALKNAAYEPIAEQKIEATFGNEKYKLATDETGMANLKFLIMDTTKSIHPIDFWGYLSSYKRADYKDETFSIPLAIHSRKADLQFLPESGYMVDGIPSKIGFKATDSNGHPIAINGMLKDSQGSLVSVVQTIHDGMGYFNIVPRKAETYTFESFSHDYDFSDVKFPEILTTGLTLKFLKMDDTTAYIKILHNFLEAPGGSININHSGFSYLLAQGKFLSGTHIEVPIRDLPAGIMRVTFFDTLEQPMAERLVFVNKHKILRFNPNLNHTFLRTRKPSILDVHVTDFRGKPVKTHLSISVIDSVYCLGEFTKASSIVSSYLLHSELKGTIPDPEFYFTGENKEPYLDLLMITHGWRRFSWYKSIRNYREETKKMINHDKVEGQLLKRGEPVNDGQVTFIALSGMPPKSVNVDSTGKFWFMPRYDTYFAPDLLLKATSEKYKERVDIKIMPYDSLKNVAMARIGFKGLAEENAYMQKVLAEKATEPQQKFMLGDTKLLEMVNVTATKKDEFANSPKEMFGASRTYYKTYKDFDFMTDFSSLVQQTAPNIMIDYSSGRASFLGANSSMGTTTSSDPYSGPGLLLVIDDIARGKVLNEFDYLTIDDILDITVIRGNEAFYMYGAQANEGAIIVRTRIDATPNSQNSIFDKRNMEVLPAYCFEREFYAPKYDTFEKLNDPVPNLRTTIYWQNDVVTDENGNATIEWYNNDLTGAKVIRIEAFGENGQPGSYTRTYQLR